MQKLKPGGYSLKKSAKTAISRKGPSRPAQNFYTKYCGCVRKGQTILDYGCGKSADVTWLSNKGLAATGFDPNYTNSSLKKTYDYILCTYVLNVIEPERARRYVIEHIFSLLALNGTAYITVRAEDEVTKNAVKSNWIKRGNGYITSIGTYQEGFDVPSLMNLIATTIRNIDASNDYTIAYFVEKITKNYITILFIKCSKIIGR